jgi:L-fuculose-phosphate aldolase
LNEYDLRKSIIRVCHLLYDKGLVAATDGNVSARLGPDRFLMTPSALNKGVVEANDLIVIDSHGKRIRGDRPVTSEWRMHLAIYEERADAMSVVHAHPPMTTSCTLVGISLMEPVLPEVYLSLGGIPTLPYATPSSPEGALVIREPIRSHDAVILDRHGAIALGKTVDSAYYKIEKIENAALVLLAARQFGPVPPLSFDQKARLDKARGSH